MNNIEVLSEVIKSRRTIRKYKSVKPPLDLIEKILEAGCWAPSVHNIQPWKFVVVNNEEIILSIYEIMMKKEKTLFAGFNIIMRETAKHIMKCPCLIAVYADSSATKKFSRFGEHYKRIVNICEIQSISFAIENIMLSAHAAGLGLACFGIALFCEKEINRLLNQNYKMQALLSLGFPDEIPSIKKRKPLSEVMTCL